MSEQKIQVPGHAERQKEIQAREQSIQEVRGILEEQQRKAAAEDPYGPQKTKIPPERMKDFSAEEIERLHMAEDVAFKQAQRQARAYDAERRSWISRGGSEEAFEEYGQVLAGMPAEGGAEGGDRHSSAYD